MRPRHKLLPALLSAGVLLPSAAFAANGALQFAGTVLRTCAITLGTPGVLDTNAAGTVLSSKTGIGAPAHATIVTTGNDFKLDVTSPVNFTVAPPGFSGTTEFESFYSMAGSTSVLNLRAGAQTLLSIGTATLTVDLVATKPLGFPAGPYVAQTTLTCE